MSRLRRSSGGRLFLVGGGYLLLADPDGVPPAPTWLERLTWGRRLPIGAGRTSRFPRG